MGTFGENTLVVTGSKVGIGETTPDSLFHLSGSSNNAIITLENNGNGNVSGIDFVRERSSGTGVNGGSIFVESNTGHTHSSMYLQTQTAGAGAGVTSALTDNNGVRVILGGGNGVGSFIVENGSSESLRINRDGNVLVGKTTANDGATAGIEQQGGGALYIAKNATNLLLNRLSTDGEIVNFRKDGTTVGSIGTTSTALELSTPNGTSNTAPSSANGDDARDIRIAAGNGGDGGSNGNGGDGGSIILDPGSGGDGDNSGPNGQVNVIGTLTKSAGSFKINHPDPVKTATHDLYHSFVESPTAGDNIYRWQVTTTNGSAVIDLPDYYQHLNENDQVWVSPVRHFGQGYGEVSTDQTQLNVYSNTDGVYNVLLIGTRKDLDAVKSWKGVERLK